MRDEEKLQRGKRRLGILRASAALRTTAQTFKSCGEREKVNRAGSEMSSARNWVCGAAMTAMSLAAWAAPARAQGHWEKAAPFPEPGEN